MEARLSGPRRGKDESMADENIEEVNLTPEDIPGAAVENEEIGKLTVNQLKFWLKCRRINQSGNKQALYERFVMLRVLLLLFVLVAFVFLVLVIFLFTFFTGSKILIPCQKLGKKFTIQTRTNHIRRPKLLNAEKLRETWGSLTPIVLLVF